MNRNNCGCAPYKATTNRMDYMRELYDTCDCVLPCKSCECVEQTGTCPPPPPCKPVQRMKCCVEKPKKGFWQLLLGGVKCTPSFKKKQDKKRKQVRTLKCVPVTNSNNDLCECQQAPSKFNSNSCPRKGCLPTPKSICGCHFYFNIENRTRKHCCRMAVATKDQQLCETNETPLKYVDETPECDIDNQQIYENNETSVEYSYDFNEEPERDNLTAKKELMANPKNERNGYNNKNPIQNISTPNDRKSEGNRTNISQKYLTSSKIHRRSANERRKTSSLAFHPYDGQCRRSTGIGCNSQRKSSVCTRKRQSSCSGLPVVTETCSKNDVHIDVTFTKEETKYFMPNNDTCSSVYPEQNNKQECKNSDIGDSKENSEQLLTIEIHKDGVKLSQNEDGEEVDSLDVYNDHKRPKRGMPHSESLSRELLPLMKRKSTVGGSRAIRLSLREDESDENMDNAQRQQNKNRYSLLSKGYSKANLDRRVSEILNKINEIENKINIIEKKGQDNKKIRVDFDGAKSTVSLHIKDPSTKKHDNDCNYNNNSKIGSGNTVIEIRHSQSKSSSTARRSFQENELCSSKSLDACDKNQPSSHKIVIKLPKVNAKTQCYVLPEKENKKFNENYKQTIMWNDVSNELKCSPLKVSKKCYCYECVQKRLRCL